MKIVYVATGKAADVNDFYAARLLEQGQARLAPKEQKKKPTKRRTRRKAVASDGAD